MSKVHYFQRYSTLENMVTNNVLQLLARVYDYSAPHLSMLLTELIGIPVELGISIDQQKGIDGAGAVPDAMIAQESFKIVLEAKVDAPVDIEQLVRHLGAFSQESLRVLLLLTKQRLSDVRESEIRSKISQRKPGVIFKSLTYEDICKSIPGLFKDHESDMVNLCNDFVEYCNDTRLFDQSAYLLRIVPCSHSYLLNGWYGVYFHPSDRGYTNHSYLGIYANKSVRFIWKIDSIFDVTLEHGILNKARVQGPDTDEYDEKIKAIISDAKHHCNYEVASGHRFFCGQPFTTDYQKASKMGIQGAQFRNLKDVLKVTSLDTVSEIAASLTDLKWE